MSDLISRQTAIDALLHNQEIYSNNFGTDAIDKYTIAIIDNDVQTIAQLPSAQPERKKGQWAKQTDENCWWYECSECGDYPMKNAYGREELSAYCPHCGAKMDYRRKGVGNK